MSIAVRVVFILSIFCGFQCKPFSDNYIGLSNARFRYVSIVGRCRAHCIESFTSINLESFQQQQAFHTCDKSIDCSNCWQFCYALHFQYELNAHVCSNPYYCLLGCQVACNFNSNPTIGHSRESWEFQDPLIIDYQPKEYIDFEWSAPKPDYEHADDKFVVYAVFVKADDGSPFEEPYRDSMSDVTFFYSDDQNLIQNAFDWLIVAISKNGVVAHRILTAVEQMPDSTTVSALTATEIQTFTVRHKSESNSGFNPKRSDGLASLTIVIIVIALAAGGAVGLGGFCLCRINHQKRRKRSIRRRHAIRVKTTTLTRKNAMTRTVKTRALSSARTVRYMGLNNRIDQYHSNPNLHKITTLSAPAVKPLRQLSPVPSDPNHGEWNADVANEEDFHVYEDPMVLNRSGSIVRYVEKNSDGNSTFVVVDSDRLRTSLNEQHSVRV